MRNKNNRKKMIDLLYKSFDAELTPSERKILEESLTNDPALRRENEQAGQVRAALRSLSGRRFEALFADRILVRLREEAEDDFFTSLLWVFRRMIVIGAATIILLMLNNVISSGDLSLDGAFGIPRPTLEEALSVNQFMGGR